MLSKRHRRVDRQIREKINELEKRIIQHEHEADIYKGRMDVLYETFEKETNQLEKEKIQGSINYCVHSMNYHIRKSDKLGERMEGLEIALKILNQ